MNYRALKDKTMATYFTVFIGALLVMVGFILGVITTTNLAISLLP